MIVGAALGSVALVGSPAAGAQVRQPSEDVITNKPIPPVQGPPGSIRRELPCGMNGPAVLDDGNRYPSGRRPLRAAIIFVDFSDAPAGPGSAPQEVFNRLVPRAQRVLRGRSYRKFRLAATPHLRWVRMPKPLSSYGFGEESTEYDRYEGYIADAVRAAARSFDMSKFKTVYVIAGPNAHPPEAATQLAAGGGIKVGGTRVVNTVTLDGYNPDTTSAAVVHETGHVLGLPDLYKTSVDTDLFRFVGPWDLMSDIYGASPMLSWTRRMVGWLGNRNFRCAGRRRRTVNLKWVASGGRTKGVIVRIGRRRAYVIEARTDAVGKGCPRQGVLIYRWNGTVESGEGPIRVMDAQPGEGACGPHTTALFKPGQRGRSKYRDRYIAVSVLGRAKNGFRVQVRQRAHPRRR